ncbi:DUF6807 family protein [Actinomyces ruminis]|uniref:Methane oxygenase PmoA n=1 Tax=Actinomyces ruminis TaxID=1937003 RepID=A0ABX4MD23_9ACTO|nr:DUF6807 family protein [Actinomyces ruminis]PHP53399.1 hypothetical protein BW737_002570 [Actinomyces ruminis]
MTIDLTGADRSMLLFEAGDTLVETTSPRPYLHPIRSPGGTLLTEIAPADHPHHMGLSLALPDVNGNHFWGGKTYVPGRGYLWENRHGRQQVIDVRLGRLGEKHSSGNVFSGRSLDCTIDWIGADGVTQLIEDRSITWSGSPPGASTTMAVLSWSSAITPRHDAVISTPGARGRVGAGYGGIFWRFPRWFTWEVFSPEALGEERVNGSCGEWITMHAAPLCASQAATGRPGVSVVLRQRGPYVPWFVRTSEYPGAGPALAWQESLRLPGGRPFMFGMDALILDADLSTAAQVERVLAEVGWGQ